MHAGEVVLNNAAQSLYQDSQATLSVLADNTLKMAEPAGLGIHEYAINPSAAGVWSMEFAALSYSAPVAYFVEFAGNRHNLSHQLQSCSVRGRHFSIVTDASGVITSMIAEITTPHP